MPLKFIESLDEAEWGNMTNLLSRGPTSVQKAFVRECVDCFIDKPDCMCRVCNNMPCGKHPMCQCEVCL